MSVTPWLTEDVSPKERVPYREYDTVKATVHSTGEVIRLVTIRGELAGMEPSREVLMAYAHHEHLELVTSEQVEQWMKDSACAHRWRDFMREGLLGRCLAAWTRG